jgi:hypothetical protein
MYRGRSEYVLLLVLYFQKGKIDLPCLCLLQNQFLGGVTCKLGSVIHKTTRSAKEYNVNMSVIEKQMLHLELHWSVSGICPVVHIILSVFNI